MADKKFEAPPANINGISRPGRGKAVVKPKDLKGTTLRLWKLTKDHRHGMGWLMLCSALTSASSIFSPYVIGIAVSRIKGGDTPKWILLFLAMLYLTNWLLRFVQQYGMARIGQRMIHYIRCALFDKVETLPLTFFDRHQHGELMSRLTNDVDNISTTISNSLTLLMTYLFTVIGILMIMLILSPLMTLVMLTSTFFIIALTKVITKHTSKLFAKQQKELGRLNGHIEESISGIMVVKAFCMEDHMETSFKEKNNALCDASIRALICSGYLMPIMNVINNLCYVEIAVASALLYLQGVISSIGLITSFLLYVRQFTRPFVEIANIYNNFQTAVAGAERIFEIMDEESEPADLEDALPLHNPKGDITLDHVSFGYTADKMVLNDISLHIPAGTKVAIVGPTGSGKTTIVNLLTRFYDVTKGSITLDGHDLREYKISDLRDSFGVVLQDTSLFADSVKNNLCYGNRSIGMESIEAVAENTGLEDFIRRLPDGYDTVLTQGGNELSQGERQLLTIARAMLTNAPIMILDEATSSVDTVTEQKIRKTILELCRNRTSFIIAHRLSTIRDSDLILLLEDGRITEQGTHDELMLKNGKYAAMYRTQTGRSLQDECP